MRRENFYFLNFDKKGPVLSESVVIIVNSSIELVESCLQGVLVRITVDRWVNADFRVM